MPPLTGFLATLPADVLLDSGVLFINSDIPFGVSKGGLAFDPAITYENIDFDDKRYPIQGLDRREGGAPKISGTIIELSNARLLQLEAGATQTGTAADTTTTPQIAGDLLALGAYLTEVRVAYRRGNGKFAIVRFPFAIVTKYSSKGNAKGQVEISIEIEARNDTDTGAAPYEIHLADSTGASEIALWRSAIVGGDSAIKWLYSVLSNVTAVAGAISAIDDARGNVGYGPTLAKIAGSVVLLGSGPADWYIKPDGVGGVLRSAAATPLANASGPFTMVYIGSDEQGGVPVDVEDPADVNTAGALIYMDGLNGAIAASMSPWNGIFPSPPDPYSAQGSPSVSTGKIRVVLFKSDGAGNVQVKVGILPVESRSGATAVPSRDLKIAIGGQVQNTNYAGNKIRAVAMIGHVTSDAEDLAIYQLAASKHGAVCTGSKIAVFDGDSNTFGTGLAKISDRCSVVLMERASWTQWDDPNTGIPGAEIRSGGSSSLLDNYATKVRPLLQNAAPGGKKAVVLGNGAGGNDLDTGARTGAQVWADMLAYNALVQADGATLVVTTPLPRVSVTTLQATYNSERANLRAAILAGAAAAGIKVADLGGDPAFSSDVPNATYFQADNLHLNPTGHLKCADLTEAALLTV